MGRREPCQILRKNAIWLSPWKMPRIRGPSAGPAAQLGRALERAHGSADGFLPISIRRIGLRPADAGQTFDGRKRRRLDEGGKPPGPRHPDEVGLLQRAQL